MSHDYGGAIAMAENGGDPIPDTDWMTCADCGRPMYYDTDDDGYHHAILAGEGCFLIPPETRVDDLDHPLLADADLVDAAYADYERASS